jgi:hypothetical protein
LAHFAVRFVLLRFLCRCRFFAFSRGGFVAQGFVLAEQRLHLLHPLALPRAVVRQLLALLGELDPERRALVLLVLELLLELFDLVQALGDLQLHRHALVVRHLPGRHRRVFALRVRHRRLLPYLVPPRKKTINKIKRIIIQ